MLISRAEVDGRVVDVRVRGESVTDIGELRPDGGETEIDAAGGALLPGLHDHHLHLLSMAAAATSVWCGPPQVTDVDGLARALRAAPGRRVRGIGYHESVAGIPDRQALDRLVADRPVRLQHRGGALWVLNTEALLESHLLAEAEDGRLWRADHLLRVGQYRPDLTALGRQLAAYGVTGVTDATPNLSADVLTGLPQRLHVLGRSKILPADHVPPDWATLHEQVTVAHAAGRPVAVHAVTRESLALTIAVLTETGTLPGDRLEHAAVVGADAVAPLAQLGVTVVTQPSFPVERAAEYRRDVPESEHADLYRYASLLAAGIRVAPSSDAPFASADPWRTIAAASTRDLAPAERVPARTVLAGLLSPLSDPGGPPRRVVPGVPADLCLLRVPLTEALSTPDAEAVAVTICRGQVVYG
ncbi:MAG TPA: amidohydrolase family protein [Pseudonocardiaceae bacterium]|jgi:predicted amidohydrolase YtcJ|nr:amidohydrolase family protein [Pseudonocardiaceae bacterium]